MRLTSSHEKLRILLIEDSKGDALLLAKLLNHTLPETHTLTKATSLAAAIDILCEAQFDVALLDRSLPDVEGFSGLHTIQNIAPQLPIVYLTAYKDEDTAFEAIEQGAQDYLFKDAMDGHMVKRAIQYAILRKQFEGVLILRANFDMLTGLANRTLFESRMEMALARMKRQGGTLAVLFLDLNQFKQINDRLGHAMGDLLLQEVGCRIKSVLRPYDTAARMGGDEFALLLEGLPEPHHSEVVAQKIIQRINMPFMLSSREYKIGISIGITTCTRDQNFNCEILVQQADEAMYVAKSSSESTYRIYDDIASHQQKKMA